MSKTILSQNFDMATDLHEGNSEFKPHLEKDGLYQFIPDHNTKHQ